MEAEKAEAIESEIDRIIERRAKERKDANRVEELWRDSSRVHNARCRRERIAEWYAHHVALSDVHRRLAEENERKALRLLDGDYRGEVGS